MESDLFFLYITRYLYNKIWHLYWLFAGNNAAPTQGYFPEKGQNNQYQPPSSQDSYGSPLGKPVSNYGSPAGKPPAPVGAPSYVGRWAEDWAGLRSDLVLFRVRRPADGWEVSFQSTPASPSLTSSEIFNSLSVISWVIYSSTGADRQSY